MAIVRGKPDGLNSFQFPGKCSGWFRIKNEAIIREDLVTGKGRNFISAELKLTSDAHGDSILSSITRPAPDDVPLMTFWPVHPHRKHHEIKNIL